MAEDLVLSEEKTAVQPQLTDDLFTDEFEPSGEAAEADKAEAGKPEAPQEYRRVKRHRRSSIERLRLLLMFFMCINLFGFPTIFGSYVETICGFVPIAFFILSGFLVLRPDKNRSARIRRAIKRSAITFIVLAVVYFAVNLIYYRMQGINVFPAFRSKRFWFNFLVMNVWQYDIGSSIWYVQALLYAYIIIYFLDKWKLLKYDRLICAVLILFTVVTGELSGVIRWEVAGYSYIPGNFFTRALPYILLGGTIHRKIAYLKDRRTFVYTFSIVIGVLLIVGEIILLGSLGVPGYYGHLIGMPVIAFSVCMLAIRKSKSKAKYAIVNKMSRWHINCIYYLCPLVSSLLALLLAQTNITMVALSINWIGMATFLVCFLLALLIADIDDKYHYKKLYGHWPRRQKKTKHKTDKRLSAKESLDNLRQSLEDEQEYKKTHRHHKSSKPSLGDLWKSYKEERAHKKTHHRSNAPKQSLSGLWKSYKEERAYKKAHRRHKRRHHD